MAQARARAIVHGMVQGVGFRYSTQREAARNKVAGWVKNNYDGTVEAVVEGERENVEKMVGWLHQGPAGSEVRSVDVSWEEPTGEFKSFNIRYS